MQEEDDGCEPKYFTLTNTSDAHCYQVANYLRNYQQAVEEELAYLQGFGEKPSYLEESDYLQPTDKEPDYMRLVGEEPDFLQPMDKEPDYLQLVGEEPDDLRAVNHEPGYQQTDDDPYSRVVALSLANGQVIYNAKPENYRQFVNIEPVNMRDITTEAENSNVGDYQVIAEELGYEEIVNNDDIQTNRFTSQTAFNTHDIADGLPHTTNKRLISVVTQY